MRFVPAAMVRGVLACAAGLVVAGGAGIAVPAAAADYKSVGNDPAILYDAPTLRGSRLFVAPRGMPVEVIVAQGDWARVRDANGALAWVERRLLVDKRTVVVGSGAGSASIHAQPSDASPVVFRAQSGVELDLVGAPAAGWVAVRHRDGDSGYAKVNDVWGE